MFGRVLALGLALSLTTSPAADLPGVPAERTPVELGPYSPHDVEPEIAQEPPGQFFMEDSSVIDEAPGEHPPGHGLAVLGVVMVGTSTLAYIGTAVALGVANTARDELPSVNPEDSERRQELTDRRDRANNAAIGLGVSALALMGTGIALIFVGRAKAEKALRARKTVMAVPTRGGALFGWSGRF